MKTLANKIGQLAAADYDKTLKSKDEMIAGITLLNENVLDTLKKYDIHIEVIGSEIIYSKEEIEALKAKEVSFRDQDNRADEIAALTGYIQELEGLLQSKVDLAKRLERSDNEKAKHAATIEKFKPMVEQLEAMQKELKGMQKDIMYLRTSKLHNPIKPELFKIFKEIAAGGK